ncbi:MAG TPA: sensor histidine kinase [Asanoa sp.]
MRWVTRGFGAVGRGLALAGLALASAVSFVGHLALFTPGLGLGMVFLLPGPMAWARWLPDLARREAGGVRRPYADKPQPPVRGDDGFFRSDRQLYKHRWWPWMEKRIEWVLSDVATWRDLLWLALNPVVGLLLALGPAGLLAGGVAVVMAATGAYAWWAVPVGLAVAVAGVAVAPAFVRAHAGWTRALLGPVRDTTPGVTKQWLRGRFVALYRLGALALLTVASAAWAVLSLIVLALFAVGLVIFLPTAAQNMRPMLNLRRRLAGEWSGTPVPRPYRPYPELPPRRPDGFYQVGKHLYKTPQWTLYNLRMNWVWHDPATWRDILFVTLDPMVGGAVLLASLGAFVYGLWFTALPAIWSLVGVPDAPSAPVLGDHPVLALLLGLAIAVVGVAVAPTALRVNGGWASWLLAPTEKARLDLRVRELTQSRTDATEAQAAELRRIERDLHDGAQARLVAVGMTLGTIERLLDRDPTAARRLLAEARETSAKALAELRDLVRGIHPPVLAERGLGPSVEALALDAPLPVAVVVDLPGRLDPPVEAAVYFAVSEALANAVKHARARKMTIALTHDGGTLRAVVEDDGRGGADPGRGSGLRGMRHRLAAFDGTVRVDSPTGGPTTVTLEVPCASSSPRTSTC